MGVQNMRFLLVVLIASPIVILCAVIIEVILKKKKEKKKVLTGSMNNNAGTLTSQELLEKYKGGMMTKEDFLKQFGNHSIFYSTPFGDHKDGSKKLFVLPGPDGTAYNPVFSSQEKVVEFYEKAGRAAYMIMEGTFLSFLETTDKINEKSPVKLGAVIDPGYFGVTVDANQLKSAIRTMKL